MASAHTLCGLTLLCGRNCQAFLSAFLFFLSLPASLLVRLDLVRTYRVNRFVASLVLCRSPPLVYPRTPLCLALAPRPGSAAS